MNKKLATIMLLFQISSSCMSMNDDIVAEMCQKLMENEGLKYSLDGIETRLPENIKEIPHDIDAIKNKFHKNKQTLIELEEKLKQCKDSGSDFVVSKKGPISVRELIVAALKIKSENEHIKPYLPEQKE